MRRLWEPLNRVWGAIRQILSIRGLLEWLGWWKVITAAAPSIATSIWAHVYGLPAPVVAVLGMVVFAACLVIWRALQMAKAEILYKQEFNATKPPFAATLGVKLIRPPWWRRIYNWLDDWRKG